MKLFVTARALTHTEGSCRHSLVLSVLGRCMQLHRHQEFIRFLNAVEAAVPAGKLVHVILDNYGTHKHPKVMAWLDGTRAGPSTHANLRLFAECRRDLLLGHNPPPPAPQHVRSLVDLQAAIHRYLAEHNADPKPFVWTATPEKIMAKLEQLNASVH